MLSTDGQADGQSESNIPILTSSHPLQLPPKANWLDWCMIINVQQITLLPHIEADKNCVVKPCFLYNRGFDI